MTGTAAACTEGFCDSEATSRLDAADVSEAGRVLLKAACALAWTAAASCDAAATTDLSATARLTSLAAAAASCVKRHSLRWQQPKSLCSKS